MPINVNETELYVKIYLYMLIASLQWNEIWKAFKKERQLHIKKNVSDF